jgi:hypothetical protein
MNMFKGIRHPLRLHFKSVGKKYPEMRGVYLIPSQRRRIGVKSRLTETRYYGHDKKNKREEIFHLACLPV